MGFLEPQTQTCALQAETTESWTPSLGLNEVSGHSTSLMPADQCHRCQPSYSFSPPNPRMLGHLLQESKRWRSPAFFPFSCWEAEKGSKQPIWRDKGPEGQLCQPSGGARPPGRLPPPPPKEPLLSLLGSIRGARAGQFTETFPTRLSESLTFSNLFFHLSDRFIPGKLCLLR